MNKVSDLSFKGINKLAIPAIITGIAEPLLSITDTAIVGNVAINPLESLAAVGIAGSFIAALIWILAQTRTAISATIGRYLGAKKLDEIMGLPAQIIALNLVLSVVIYLVSVFFSEAIFSLYNAQGLTLNYAVDYYNIRALGFPLTLFVFSVFGVFRGLQNTYWPMLISLVGVFLNVGLDFIFVFGIEGVLAPMHIEGAAWASVISQLVMALMAFVLMLRKTPFNFKITLKFHPEIKNILQISFNLIIRAISLNVALIMANAYATKYGDAYIAAQTIAFQIWLFFAFFIDGYASVGNIVSGKLKGEANSRKDKLEGPYKEYYESGKIKAEGNMRKDKLEGLYKEYYESGKVKEEGNFRKGEWEGPYKEYYKNGKVKEEGNFRKGKLEGPHKTYYIIGKVELEENYRKGKLEGPFKQYYKNGRIELEGNYRKGKKEGLFKEYDESGGIKAMQKYKDGKLYQQKRI